MRCNLSLFVCTILAKTFSVYMHRQAVYVPKAKPLTPGRLDTCEGLTGIANTHILRSRHQLRLSLQQRISVTHRSRSCSRHSVSSAWANPEAYEIVKHCTALAMPCRSSLWATAIAASHGRPGAVNTSKSRLLLTQIGPQASNAVCHRFTFTYTAPKSQ